MLEATRDEIAKVVGGKVEGSFSPKVSGVATDSRLESLSELLFIPLVGENFDAHKFVPQAVEKNAAILLVHSWDPLWDPLRAKAEFILVDDTLVALQKLGQYWRRKQKAKVLALTGSNGKTTTKDFLSQILREQGRTTASLGSFNNHWGVPLTLCTINPEDKYVVVEMGMNHPGELAELSPLVEADIVCVTNVGRAHLGFFKDVECIAKAKQEIYDAAASTAKFIFNRDNLWTAKMEVTYSERDSLSFSTQQKDADIYLSLGEEGDEVTGHIGGVKGLSNISFWGLQNIENLACAATMAVAAGIKPEKVWQLISKCQTSWGRNQWVSLESGGRALFDGYNANPDSFGVLVDNLHRHPSKSDKMIGVFGEMLELGEKSAQAHEELGARMATLGWEHIFFIGPSGGDFLRGWDNQVQSIGENKNNPVILSSYKDFLDLEDPFVLDPSTLVVVKGSRGQKLERVIAQLSPVDFSF